MARIEQAERTAYTTKIRADKAHRKQMRRSEEYATLHEEGLELGIPENQLRVALARGLREARALVDEFNRRHDIVALANQCGYEKHIQHLLQENKVSDAGDWLLQARKVAETAKQLGVGEEVHQHLELGNLSKAEAVVGAAEKRCAAERDRDALRTRIQDSRLSEVERRELEARLASLDGSNYATRPYRMALYEIKSRIESRVS